MITADKNFTIPSKYKDNLGWNALYDRSKDATIEAGVVLTYVDPTHEILMFEVGENINLLDFPQEVSVVPGSCIADAEVGAVPYEVVGFHLDRCRFPTQDEIDWYNKLNTI